MSSSSFRRGTSHLPSATDLIHDATDMNESLLASLLLVMSHNATHDSDCAPIVKKNCSSVSFPSLPALSLQRLPAEELTVDTATAAVAVAAVAATTKVSTVRMGGARARGA